MNDFDFLKVTAIQEKVLANSGMNSEEFTFWQKAESKKAIARLKELNLDIWINSHPNVLEIETKPEGRVYKVVNSKSIGFTKKSSPLTVFCSIGIKSDMKLWLHVSVSGAKLPTYSDLVLVKNIFIGQEKTAIQIFPASDHHVNDHPNCLHLWHCLEENTLPEFSHFGTI